MQKENFTHAVLAFNADPEDPEQGPFRLPFNVSFWVSWVGAKFAVVGTNGPDLEHDQLYYDQVMLNLNTEGGTRRTLSMCIKIVSWCCLRIQKDLMVFLN